ATRHFVSHEFGRNHRRNAGAPRVSRMLLHQTRLAVAFLARFGLRVCKDLVLTNSNVLHLRGDDSFARIVHLRDVTSSPRATRSTNSGEPETSKRRISSAVTTILRRDIGQLLGILARHDPRQTERR